MNARTTAIARNDEAIEQSRQRALAAKEKQPKNALEAMAQRLQVSPAGLKETLLKTVFRECKTDAEFIALTVVANQYNLDPLRREIYAFPAKGGGIVPIIGYDGWIRIMNEHPQFDGLEFDHITDSKGKVTAVEGILYRKDRERPIKKMIYLDEFRVDTNPNWKARPNHMLDVRCLCHTVRIGLGVSAGVEGEEVEFGGTRAMQDADYLDEPISLPSADELDAAAEQETHDPETGEVSNGTGMTEVDEETARELDRRMSPEAEQTLEDIDGPLEQEPEPEPDPKAAKLVQIRKQAGAAETLAQMKKVDAEWTKHRAVYDDDTVKLMDDFIAAGLRELKGAAA